MKVLTFNVSKDVYENKDRFIHVPRFAESVLDLKGVELLVYSVIYNFSQLEKKDGKWRCLGNWHGSFETLADLVNATKMGAYKAVQSLLEKGFIIKRNVFEEGKKFCKFYAVPIEYEYDEPSRKEEDVFEFDNTDLSSQIEEENTEAENNKLWEETKVAPKTQKVQKKEKIPLINREPKNDIERVEKVYLQNYAELYNNGFLKFEKPVVNWTASRRLTKECISNYGLQNIINAVNNAKENQFVLEKGYCLTTILSAGVLAGLMNGTGKTIRNGKSYGYVKGVGTSEEVTDEILKTIRF